MLRIAVDRDLKQQERCLGREAWQGEGIQGRARGEEGRRGKAGRKAVTVEASCSDNDKDYREE